MFNFDALLTGWLLDTALRVTLLLLLGAAFMHCVRQPVKRQRIGECTLAGCLLLALLSAASPLPALSLGLFASGEPTSNVGEPRQADAVQAAPQSSTVTTRDAVAAPRHEPLPGSMDKTSLPPASGPPIPPDEPGPFPWRRLVGGLYLLGVAAGLIWLGLGQWGLYRIARRARMPDDAVRAVWEELAASAMSPSPSTIGSKTSPSPLMGEGSGGGGPPRRSLAFGPARLLVSSHVGRPITFGLLRPVVVIPERLCDSASRQRLRMVLRHELAHVARRDALTWLLAAAVQVLFFYQPLYWWLRRQLRLCQEYVADAWAAEAAGSQADYAQHLFTLLTEPLCPVPRAAGAMGVLEHRSEFYRRIAMLTQPHKRIAKRCTMRWSIATGLTTVTSAVALCALTLVAARSSEAIEPAPSAIAQAQTQRPEPSNHVQAAELEDGPVPTERILALINDLGGDASDAELVRAMKAQFVHRGLLRFAQTERVLHDEEYVARLKALYREEVGHEIPLRELVSLVELDQETHLLGSPMAQAVLEELPSVIRARALPSVRISGFVMDAVTNKAIEGAFISRGIAVLGVRTGPEGFFEFEVRTRPRSLYLRVDAEGYARKDLSVPTAGEAQNVRIDLERGVKLEGRVEDEDGKPISDARTELVSVQERAPAIPQVTWTDKDGRFVFEHATPGVSYSAEATHPRYQTANVQQIEPGAFVLVNMLPGREVFGMVRDPNGRAVAGALVEAVKIADADDERFRLKAGQLVVWRTAKTRSGADGRYAFRSLEPGTWSVEVDPRGYAPSRAVVIAGDEPRPLDFHLVMGRRISGVVVDQDGKPVPHAHAGWIHWGEKTPEDGKGTMPNAQRIQRFTRCDEQGRFVFETLPEETITINALMEGPRRLGGVTVPPGEDEIEIQLKEAPLP